MINNLLLLRLACVFFMTLPLQQGPIGRPVGHIALGRQRKGLQTAALDYNCHEVKSSTHEVRFY